MQKKSVYLVINGRVQGVGYRYFAKVKADEIQITGWVKNLPDGKVEIEAEGDLQNLETYLDWLKNGPARAIIRTFTISEIPVSGHKKFNIR